MKTSRAARDRPEPNPRRIQPSRHRWSFAGAAAGGGAATTKNSRRRRTTPRQARRTTARTLRVQQPPAPGRCATIAPSHGSKPHATLRIVAPLQAHGRTPHRATNCAQPAPSHGAQPRPAATRGRQSSRNLARRSGEGGDVPCATICTTHRHLPAAMRGQRAWLSRTHVRAAGGRGPPHAAAAGGRIPRIFYDLNLKFSSFKRLAALKIEDIYAKEEQVLSWSETDSTRIDLQRRMYILTKYRELLLRKFPEARKTNFVFGQSSSAIDLKVLAMLSYLHLFVLEDLKTEMQAHGLIWEMTCCSRIFEGPKRDRSAMDDIQSLDSSSSRDLMDIHVDTPVLFTTVDALQGTDTVVDQSLLISTALTATAFTESSRSTDSIHSESIKSVRKEARTQGDVLSVKLNEFRKELMLTMLSSLLSWQIFERRSRKWMSSLLLFGVKCYTSVRKHRKNHLNLSTQLGFLVDYINRGGDAKKGEGGSSRPQPPSDDQNRPSDDSGSRVSGGDGSSQRRGSGGSLKKRHSSSSGGVHPVVVVVDL
ncbi:hypothetical protein F511_12829 [Dorcoceras hygrometricum]|uniref:Uncharacterized protein n=1 Tax=Dorcoceras hygrometricum TaxID=472368 RepID=A0A2Z7CRW4_9LAMI|nr:hypothetical protein F511_12829 [Dorcoceras hygrometricum]